MSGVQIPQVSLPDGHSIPALGQGSWNIGDNPAKAAAEIRVLRDGIERGLALIDTAEMYGDGNSERLVGKAIAGVRAQVFLVTKILPQNASAAGIPKHCEASLKRLGTDVIDLYLLHWEGRYRLQETVAAFEKLRQAGKIRYWGVSNLDLDRMVALTGEAGGQNCATDQVLYHPGERGPEFDLVPWCRARNMPIMAYSPLGQGGKLLRAAALRRVAQRHGASPAQVALAWCLRDGNTIAIPKSADMAHVQENAAAVQIRLSAEDLAEIDADFPPPRKKQPLAMI
jgi:diketogulonate reductase-like aldo/keto reductase